jgi:hypothetical protein
MGMRLGVSIFSGYSGMAGWWHRLQPVWRPRPTKRNEDAVARSSGINGLDRVFNGAPASFCGAFFILAIAVTATACKGKHDRVTVQNEEETAPRMASLVKMNDPKTSAQMLSGFYALENNSWRWTSGKFSVLLRTPPSTAGEGGVITFAFSLPDIAIQRLKSVGITASVNGTKLKSTEYDKPGTNIFTADVPPALLTGESVRVDFALDKTIPQDVDKRILGVVATSIGISSK